MFTYGSSSRDKSSSNSMFQVVTLKSKSNQTSLQGENPTIPSTTLVCAKLRNCPEASSVFAVLAHYLTCIMFIISLFTLCVLMRTWPRSHTNPLCNKTLQQPSIFFTNLSSPTKKANFFSLVATTFSRDANKNLNWKGNLHLSAVLSPWLLYFILQGKNKCQPFQKQLSPRFTY